MEFVMSITSSARGFFLVQVNFLRIHEKSLKSDFERTSCSKYRYKKVSSKFKLLQKMSLFTCFRRVKFKFDSCWCKTFDKFHF